MSLKSTEAVRRWRKAHPDRYRAMVRQYRRNRRIRALRLLSGGDPKCACCGWARCDGPNRLEFDHIEGGGRRLTKKGHSSEIAFMVLRGESGFRVLCRACNSAIEPRAARCVLHLSESLAASGHSFPIAPRFTEPEQAGGEPRIDKPYSYTGLENLDHERMTTRRRDLTTIQLTSGTRDRLYRLKFRKTYDAFLQDLCDLYEASARDAQN